MATNTNKYVLLPISRVKTIMKSSPEVENISNESIHLVAKATELFIQYLARESFMCGSNNNELQYRDIAKIVDSDQRFEFLRGTAQGVFVIILIPTTSARRQMRHFKKFDLELKAGMNSQINTPENNHQGVQGLTKKEN